MPTELLGIGRITPLTQNVIYALPAKRCLLYCDVAAATFELSNIVTMIPATAITLDANEQIEVAAGFIRLTSAGPANITLKN